MKFEFIGIVTLYVTWPRSAGANVPPSCIQHHLHNHDPCPSAVITLDYAILAGQ
ncbi:hypothetical protein ACP5PY_24520 [Photobacterium leiognathi subsp. mandapamensis]